MADENLAFSLAHARTPSRVVAFACVCRRAFPCAAPPPPSAASCYPRPRQRPPSPRSAASDRPRQRPPRRETTPARRTGPTPDRSRLVRSSLMSCHAATSFGHTNLATQPSSSSSTVTLFAYHHDHDTDYERSLIFFVFYYLFLAVVFNLSSKLVINIVFIVSLDHFLLLVISYLLFN